MIYVYHFAIKNTHPVIRQLSDSGIQLQYNQVINSKIAVDSLNGILIKSGEYFSLCRLVGKQQRGEDLGMEWNLRLA